MGVLASAVNKDLVLAPIMYVKKMASGLFYVGLIFWQSVSKVLKTLYASTGLNTVETITLAMIMKIFPAMLPINSSRPCLPI